MNPTIRRPILTLAASSGVIAAVSLPASAGLGLPDQLAEGCEA